MAKLFYDYWFVQFDFPVGGNFSPNLGEMSAGQRGYKSNGGKMVWNKELKREIPEGWEVEKLSNRITENKSGDWGSETPHGNYTKKVNCIRGADLNGFNGLEQSNPPVRFIHKDNAFKILSEGDVVIEISGGSPTQSTGRLSFITEASMKRFENPLICSNFCKPITLKNPELVYVFVYEWNKLYDNNVFFNYEGKTSGIKNLLFDVFAKSYKTVIPEELVVRKFNKIVESIHKKKHANLTENHHLTTLRDWLLPMLMNGQVRVGEAGKKEYQSNKTEMDLAAELGESKYKNNH
jgi:type I restriction enzyme S subunit